MTYLAGISDFAKNFHFIFCFLNTIMLNRLDFIIKYMSCLMADIDFSNKFEKLGKPRGSHLVKNKLLNAV